MLRSVSDPVLIKPSQIDFLHSWNNGKDFYSYLHPPSVDQLYGILLTLTDSPEGKMAKSDRQRRQRKLEYKLKRRNSVLMANFREEVHIQDGRLQRSWSCTELGKIECREVTSTKRVSFSVHVPLPLSRAESVEMTKPTYDLEPPKFQARPILVRRASTFPSKEALTHMDFDSFVAWRRGSRLSDDVEKEQTKLSRKQEKKRSRLEELEEDKETNKQDDWWIVKIFRLGFDSCIHRRRITPSPPPPPSSGALNNNDIVISVIDECSKTKDQKLEQKY